jgi:hypothetical protein
MIVEQVRYAVAPLAVARNDRVCNSTEDCDPERERDSHGV